MPFGIASSSYAWYIWGSPPWILRQHRHNTPVRKRHIHHEQSSWRYLPIWSCWWSKAEINSGMFVLVAYNFAATSKKQWTKNIVVMIINKYLRRSYWGSLWKICWAFFETICFGQKQHRLCNQDWYYWCFTLSNFEAGCLWILRRCWYGVNVLSLSKCWYFMIYFY